ncbi:MAG: hypothetical protein J5477_03935 [Schwartzia sp.]|nr:hypothetical protein [Schwartzia sp. (in: firmicutes)]
MKIDRKSQAAREAEILIQAANERRELNKMKLPGEPVLKERPKRLDDDKLQSSIGNLLGRYGEKIEQQQQAAAAATEKNESEAWKRDLPADKPAKKSHDYRA